MTNLFAFSQFQSEEITRARSKNEQCMANMVKSLVGSFEAKGRGDVRNASESPLSERRLNRRPVTFRLQSTADWKLRDHISVPVSSNCSNRQVRALTISQ